MSEKKKIPCRVCGKLFEPCSYCQSHADVFRWRNFACSRECAAKYIDDTIAYRESLKQLKIEVDRKMGTDENNVSTGRPATVRKKQSKNNSTGMVPNHVESQNKETV